MQIQKAHTDRFWGVPRLHDAAHNLSIPSRIKQIVVTSVTLFSFLLVANLVFAAIMFNRVPPGTQLASHSVGLLDQQQVKALLQSENEAQTISITLGDNQHTYAAQELGITLDVDATVDAINGEINSLTDLPLLKLFVGNLAQPAPKYTINRAVLADQLNAIVAEESSAPVNAQLKLTAAEAQVVPSKPGLAINSDTIAQQISQNLFSWGSVDITAEAQIVSAPIREQHLRPALAAANQLLGREVTITHEETSHTIPTKDWQQILTVEDKDGLPEAVVSPTKLTNYLKKSVAPNYYIKPVAGSVNIRDGAEISRTDGKPGRELDNKGVVAKIIAQTEAQSVVSVPASFIETTAAVVTNKTYSKTNPGLLQLISDFSAETSGTYNVAVQQWTGGSLSAYHRADTPIVPASTYKAFLAAAAIHEIEAGKFTFASETGQGTIRACINEMITNSTNHCSQAILNTIGWARTDTILAQMGYSKTSLNNKDGGFMTTTARDELKLFNNYYNGSMMNTANNNYMLDLFKNQKYRNGIPAGSPGSVVANKIGFLYSWTHDSGIVYHKNGHYGLSIMTDGGSFTTIQELARRINTFMNQ